ncbi:46548_t:CDS:2 [Gigaspora margarita]|uniref:46548_t:CDS:1 n=1 Tax=Gigaspora margarita TaxID=4874 RepID=A0ABN7WNZ1_GIGMA|nr:46548_t:CDS:2 [Gigaspora margarita]
MNYYNRQLLMGLKYRNAIIEEYAKNFKTQDSENKRLRNYYDSLDAKLKYMKELVEGKKLPSQLDNQELKKA